MSTQVAPSEAQINIDKFYKQALRLEDYDLAINGIVSIIENAQVGLGDKIYAIRQLENLSDPELKDYFRDLAEGDIETEQNIELRHAANRAYWATLLTEAKNEADEERILVEGLDATITLPADGRKFNYRDWKTGQVVEIKRRRSSDTRRWAADHLCRRGKTEHMEKIAQSVNSYYSGQHAQEIIDTCSRQMELINKFESRLATMEYVLEIVDPINEPKIIGWAMKELIELQPFGLEDILVDFILRLQGDFDDQQESISFSSYVLPFSYLRQKNWTDEDFKALGIRPVHWI